jgi:YHS domain-containing protein
MLKQIAISLTVLVFLFSTALAQDNPQKEQKEIEQQTQVKNVQITDSSETASKEIWNKVCPVKGNPVEKDSPTVEYNGKVYGFCCPGCDTKFAKNPEKYAKNLSEDGTKFIGRK